MWRQCYALKPDAEAACRSFAAAAAAQGCAGLQRDVTYHPGLCRQFYKIAIGGPDIRFCPANRLEDSPSIILDSCKVLECYPELGDMTWLSFDTAFNAVMQHTAAQLLEGAALRQRVAQHSQEWAPLYKTPPEHNALAQLRR